MTRKDAEALAPAVERVQRLARDTLGTDAAETLSALAAAFHRHTAPEDFEGRRDEDLLGALIDLQHLQERALDVSPAVRVVNPALEVDGWTTPHSVVQIHHRDMPFVVDSFLMVLGRRNLTLHSMQNAVLDVARDAQGRLDASGAPGRELLIHAEVDRLEAEEFAQFETDLRETLAEVQVVVDDFPAMQDQVRAMIAELERSSAQRDAAETSESAEFLRWLLDDHFTFLGYREFEIAGEGDDAEIRQVPESALGVLRRRARPARTRRLADMRSQTRAFVLDPSAIQFSQSGTRCRVHRPAYPDHISLKVLDDHGRVVGERALLGLFTSGVYTDAPQSIPLLRRRVGGIVERAGFLAGGFDDKVLRQVLATYPREELFQSTEDELFDTALRITRNHERNQLQVFVREDRYGLFFSALVFVPREIYNTALRLNIQQVLCEELGASDAEFTSYFSESILIRTHFLLRVEPGRARDWSLERITARIGALARNWDDDLRDALRQQHGEVDARARYQRWHRAFSVGYREAFDARIAVQDIDALEQLGDEEAASGGIVLRSYRRRGEDANRMRLKVCYRGPGLALSDLVPLLENLGLRVEEQRPWDLRDPDTGVRQGFVYDFSLTYALPLDLAESAPRFEEAFLRTWKGEAHDDWFNRLVLAARVDWRDAALLRTIARWLKQTGFPFGQIFLADTLLRHAPITASLSRYFHLRHDPELEDRETEADALRASILEQLDAVESLNEDRILRRYLQVIDAVVRTNFFVTDAEGLHRKWISLKIDGHRAGDLPLPVMPREVFVCGPKMEGVHLRSGEIARGGLRWSDRIEDFRTEVLGLVKAQRVKNSVIVPEGAKGGFVITASTDGLDAAGVRALGVECYQTFIRGLLDLTDNRVGGEIVPPPGVRRHDGDDPYLVVAADKGTATFSDIANAVAQDQGFWLGDAFASGGSQGYDHKAMGITARGAWCSVQRHFHEMGVNVQKDPVTVVGIGDMSGDVFGNGMLQSPSICLLAAFNHLHVFVDPDPDPAVAYGERQRLFALPRSNWADYDTACISAGGGVWSRSAKRIELPARLQERFGITADALTPDELIRALLQADVDLIWNGGIGTYVRASTETDAEVGDRANDGLRVAGQALRCLVLGEGGNLGITQPGRIEAARAGVKLNTDFIDNAGGVDCSDHEVNLKVLLDAVVDAGDLTVKQRNDLLESWTDEVAELVLDGNRAQVRALTLMEGHVVGRGTEYLRFMTQMEAEQGLDRAVEQLPSDEEMRRRWAADEELTRPELCVLLAYAKLFTTRCVLESDLPEDSLARTFAQQAFPGDAIARFGERLPEHFVYRNLVATQIANDLVHHMGATFVTHLQEYTGASPAQVIRAWIAVREVFRIPELFEDADRRAADAAEALALQTALMRLGRRATRWVLRHRRAASDVRAVVDEFGPGVARLRAALAAASSTADASDALGPELAGIRESTDGQVAMLSIVDAASRSGHPAEEIGGAYALLAARLRLDELSAAISGVRPGPLWQAMERDAVFDDLLTLTGELCLRVAASGSDAEAWLRGQEDLLRKWRGIRNEVLVGNEEHEIAMLAMTVRKLSDLIRDVG